MPVELRKRKAPEAAVVSAPPPKKKSAVSKVTEKVKEAFSPKPKATNGAATSTSSGKVAVGDTIALETFGGEVVLNDGQPTTLQKLVDASAGGVVLFTYPKASTPGCMSIDPEAHPLLLSANVQKVPSKLVSSAIHTCH